VRERAHLSNVQGRAVQATKALRSKALTAYARAAHVICPVDADGVSRGEYRVESQALCDEQVGA
jgi:hypothetical protein